MKTSVILRKAAKWLEESFGKLSSRGVCEASKLSCCYAIGLETDFEPETSANTVMKDLYHKGAMQFQKDLYYADTSQLLNYSSLYWFGEIFDREQTNHRIMALLFAAEIAESEND